MEKVVTCQTDSPNKDKLFWPNLYCASFLGDYKASITFWIQAYNRLHMVEPKHQKQSCTHGRMLSFGCLWRNNDEIVSSCIPGKVVMIWVDRDEHTVENFVWIIVLLQNAQKNFTENFSGSWLDKKAVRKYVLAEEKVEKIGKSLEHSPQKAMTQSTQDWHSQIISKWSEGTP